VPETVRELKAAAATGGSTHWHILTPEFPPQTGGVADYVAQVAKGLRAAGDGVDVWCPGHCESNGTVRQNDAAACVHRTLGSFGWSDLESARKTMTAPGEPARLFVQWVPHGYGWRSMNVPFCLWLWNRARRGDQVELMVHEPFLGFREGTLRQDVVALVHRIMTAILLRAATRVWVSTPSWERLLTPYAFGKRLRFGWLPVPSNIPVEESNPPGGAVREAVTFGHFSTYGGGIAPLLEEIVPPLLSADRRRRMLLIGKGSQEFQKRLLERSPHLASQIRASGCVEPSDVSEWLGACDVLLQPYPEGVTARRTSIMAGLAHGIPVVTSWGRLSEAFWRESGAVILAGAEDPGEFARKAERLAGSEDERRRLAQRGRALYRERFELGHVIRTMRAYAGA
jgi:glycosyltransferase involved in cell wall biosynthesis